MNPLAALDEPRTDFFVRVKYLHAHTRKALDAEIKAWTDRGYTSEAVVNRSGLWTVIVSKRCAMTRKHLRRNPRSRTISDMCGDDPL